MFQTLVDELVARKILPGSFGYRSELKGGPDSRVALVVSAESSVKYVLKVNAPDRVGSETAFYERYADVGLFPAVVYVDPDHRYFVYRYLPGSTATDGSAEPSPNRSIPSDGRPPDNGRWGSLTA